MPPSESISSLVSASCLNHEGANLLLSGRMWEAAKTFETALSIMNVHLPWNLKPLIPMKSTKDSTNMESRGFVYTKPFFFNQQTEPTAVDRSSYLSIVLFNLALTYQTFGQGLRDGGKYLVYSKFLYEESLNLLRHQRNFDCSNVIIASLNNLACLNVEICREEDAFQMLFLLQELIKKGSVRTDTLHRDDIADVVLNVRLLLTPVCAGAA